MPAARKKKAATSKKTSLKKKGPAAVKKKVIPKKMHPGNQDEPEPKLEPVSEEFNSVPFPEIFNFIRKSFKQKVKPDHDPQGQSLTIDELDRQVRNMLSDLMLKIIETGDQKRFETLIAEYRAFINDLNLLFKNR